MLYYVCMYVLRAHGRHACAVVKVGGNAWEHRSQARCNNGNFALQCSRALKRACFSGNARSWAHSSGLSARPSASANLAEWTCTYSYSLQQFKVTSLCQTLVLTAVYCAFWSTIGTNLEARTLVCQALASCQQTRRHLHTLPFQNESSRANPNRLSLWNTMWLIPYRPDW